MTRITKRVYANGLPTTEGKSEVLIYLLITVGYISRREQQIRMK
jgi:hypothetical protein